MNNHERKIAGKIEKAGFKAKGTRGSGAVCDDADLRVEIGDKMLIECKERPKNDNVTIPYPFIKKVKFQSLKRGTDWGVVYTNKGGEDFILLSLDSFLYMINKESK